MPFEKKKRYKTAKDYKHKNIYLNESDPYQYECYKMLELCGHKQAKFLGLLVHYYIQRSGINVDLLDEKGFSKLLGFLEVQVQGGIANPLPQMGIAMQPMMIQEPSHQPADKITPMVRGTKQEKRIERVSEDNPIEAEDLDEMNDALAAFNIG